MLLSFFLAFIRDIKGLSRFNYYKKRNIWVTIFTCAQFTMKEIFEVLSVNKKEQYTRALAINEGTSTSS